jgi:hypothetical protein
MRRLLAVLLLLAAWIPAPARAQEAQVVAACGSPPPPYTSLGSVLPLTMDTTGKLCSTSAGGGSPGGAAGTVQYNNAGSFGGITGATSNGTVMTFANSDLKLLGSSTGATTFTSANAGASNFTLTLPAVTDTVAVLGTADQAMSGGVLLTAHGYSTGNITVDCGQNPQQYVVNGGAFTITAPANDGNCLLLVRNNGSAGAITFSGFTSEASHGDAITTTNTSAFTISIWRITDGTGALADYRVVAMQ